MSEGDYISKIKAKKGRYAAFYLHPISRLPMKGKKNHLKLKSAIAAGKRLLSPERLEVVIINDQGEILKSLNYEEKFMATKENCYCMAVVEVGKPETKKVLFRNFRGFDKAIAKAEKIASSSSGVVVILSNREREVYTTSCGGKFLSPRDVVEVDPVESPFLLGDEEEEPEDEEPEDEEEEDVSSCDDGEEPEDEEPDDEEEG